MKVFTFKTTLGIRTSKKQTVKAAFEDLFNNNPGLTMAGVLGGSIQRISPVVNSLKH